MKIIDIYKMPIFKLACVFEAEKYSNSFEPSNTCLEIAYVSEGRLEVTKGNERYIAEKDDILCAIRDVNTTVRTTGFHSHHVVSVDTLWKFSDKNISAFHIPYVLKRCHETEEIKRLIDEFVYSSYIYENSPGRTAELFLRILCKIDEASRKNESFYQPKYSLVAEKAKSYIQKNIKKPITQQAVAEHLGVSPSYLCSVFKKSEGMTLIHYVNLRKLTDIKNLLDKENLPMYKVAEMYGYSDANYVSALYKKLFGRNITSLPEYRKSDKL
ncbi:MAG: helix-turn-helix transcriptional regulator [Clostridia bacterium]|nr:helix-turn-helix transcriptional regulator [Clostridia bacterium]